MSKKREESPLSRGIGYLMCVGVLFWLLHGFYYAGVPDQLTANTYGGRRAEAVFIALKRIGGGERLPYTAVFILIAFFVYGSYVGFRDHFRGQRK